MRFWKFIVVSLLLGFYFISITPVHFYAHSIEIHVDTHGDDSCTLVNLIQLGQGNYLHSDDFHFDFNEQNIVEISAIVSFFQLNPALFEPSYFQLRAPPTII